MADVLLTVDNGFHHLAEVVAEIDGHDRGRRLVRAETVVVARGGDRRPEQILILVDRLDDSGEENQKLQVILGVLAG